MVVKITRGRLAPTRAIATLTAGAEPLDDFRKCVNELVQRFRSEPATPQRFLALENALHAAAAEGCRQVLECEANRLEPRQVGSAR
jgi:hypothetical protein